MLVLRVLVLRTRRRQERRLRARAPCQPEPTARTITDDNNHALDMTDDGCLQCPWHAALYDVGTGAMVRGPQGAFKPLAGAVKATTGARSLKTFPVEVRDGAIWLVG
jgi:nitrite reductase/ring-hydroxylating ferredoxin subunit